MIWHVYPQAGCNWYCEKELICWQYYSAPSFYRKFKILPNLLHITNKKHMTGQGFSWDETRSANSYQALEIQTHIQHNTIEESCLRLCQDFSVTKNTHSTLVFYFSGNRKNKHVLICEWKGFKILKFYFFIAMSQLQAKLLLRRG